MNAKEYLLQLMYLDGKIKEDRKKVLLLKEQAEGKTSHLSPDKVQSSGSKQKQADKVCEWVDLEQQISEDEAKMNEIVNTIQLLKPYESAVLYKRYMYDRSLKEVSRDMRRSYSWVAKIHSVGVRKIQRILDERKARD